MEGGKKRGGNMTMTETRTPAPITRDRNWLVYVLVAALLAAAGGVVGWWIGSSGNESIETPAIVDQWNDAFVAGDDEAVGALFQEDAFFEGPFGPLTGRTAIQARMAESMTFADWTEIEAGIVIVLDDVVVVEADNSGMSRTLNRTDMTPFSTPVVSVYEISDGLIARMMLYYDPAELFN